MFKGKNIVALSKVPKVRDSNWILGGTGLIDDITDDNANTSVASVTTSAIPAAANVSSEYTTHTSPFSFGFQLR